MTTQHTPGPWFVSTGTTVRSRSDELGLPIVVEAFSKPDARLIAAAPDLLGFARLVAALEGKCRSEGGRHPTYAEWAVLATSIPAIARATGGGA